MEKTPLQQWAEANCPSRDAELCDAFWHQFRFIRDTLSHLLIAIDFRQHRTIMDGLAVISTFRSRGITWPVYEFLLSDGTTLTLRENSRGWLLSVNSPTPVITDFFPFIRQTTPRCEGGDFPSNRLYDTYARDKQSFTFTLLDEWEVYGFVSLFMKAKYPRPRY